MNKLKKNNVVAFPASLTEGEREIEAIVFSGSLELVKEGNLIIKQDKLYDNIYIKEK